MYSSSCSLSWTFEFFVASRSLLAIEIFTKWNDFIQLTGGFAIIEHDIKQLNQWTHIAYLLHGDNAMTIRSMKVFHLNSVTQVSTEFQKQCWKTRIKEQSKKSNVEIKLKALQRCTLVYVIGPGGGRAAGGLITLSIERDQLGYIIDYHIDVLFIMWTLFYSFIYIYDLHNK